MQYSLGFGKILTTVLFDCFTVKIMTTHRWSRLSDRFRRDRYSELNKIRSPLLFGANGGIIDYDVFRRHFFNILRASLHTGDAHHTIVTDRLDAVLFQSRRVHAPFSSLKILTQTRVRISVLGIKKKKKTKYIMRVGTWKMKKKKTRFTTSNRTVKRWQTGNSIINRHYLRILQNAAQHNRSEFQSADWGLQFLVSWGMHIDPVTPWKLQSHF